MSRISLVYCTTGNRDEALTIGRAIVTERLAACANVLDGLTSVYHWNETLQEEGEALLLLKTPTERVEDVIRRIRELHRYDCPAIVSWELTAACADYERWVCEQTLSPASRPEKT